MTGRMLEKICIVGSGNWGSTIAKIIGNNVKRSEWADPDVKLWVFEEIIDGRKLSEIINQDHENVKYLPGVKLPENVRAITDLSVACEDASLLVFVIPHQFLERSLNTIKNAANIRPGARAISMIKGLDVNGKGIDLASQLIEKSLGIDCAVMMGANLANEVAAEQFCESTIGAKIVENGKTWKRLMETNYFRLRVVDDVVSVELCGALKNIIAVGAGIVDGLKLGDNTKAAIIRIGLDEMRRFSHLFSADGLLRDPIFFESCGVADLITTCFGGRNRRIGEAHVVTGKPIEQLEAELLGGQKLQGPPAAKEVFAYLKEHGKLDEFPLMTAIYRVCYEDMPARRMIESLSSDKQQPASHY